MRRSDFFWTPLRRLQIRDQRLDRNTIINGEMEPARGLRTMLAPPAHVKLDVDVDDDLALRLFKIRTAYTARQRTSANVLIERRYSWRGYDVPRLHQDGNLDRITLVASDDDTTIGTLSIGFDGTSGLLVEELFPDEVQDLRDSGRSICEFTKLAMDSVLGSKRVLASLFHADAPNDVAPSGYNVSRPVEGLPQSPLELTPALGF